MIRTISLAILLGAIVLNVVIKLLCTFTIIVLPLGFCISLSLCFFSFHFLYFSDSWSDVRGPISKKKKTIVSNFRISVVESPCHKFNYWQTKAHDKQFEDFHQYRKPIGKYHRLIQYSICWKSIEMHRSLIRFNAYRVPLWNWRHCIRYILKWKHIVVNERLLNASAHKTFWR